MGTGQLILVLLAVVLFSTIILTTNTNLFTLAYYSYEAMISMQGFKIADAFLQEAEAYNISASMTFQDLHNYFTFADSVININSINYHVTSSANWCNEFGVNDMSGSQEYQRIDITIDCPFGNDTIRVGTNVHPISYIYASIE